MGLLKVIGRVLFGRRTPLDAELSRVGQMSGTEFELFLLRVLKAQGYQVKHLGGSGDQGVDLIVLSGSDRIAIQAKNYAKPVGNTPVQEVYAGANFHGCNKAWVVAPAGFTKGAYLLAAKSDVRLFGLRSLKQWVGFAVRNTMPYKERRELRSREKAAAQEALAEQKRAAGERPAEEALALYDAELYRYRGFLDLLEELCDIRDGKYGELSEAGEERYRTNVARMRKNLAKTREELDSLEARYPGLAQDARIEQRREYVAREREIESRVLT